MSLPVTIDKDRVQLSISMAPMKGQLQRTMLLNDFNSENTVIVENIPPCALSELETYIESETHSEQFHLLRTDESPSSALLTCLQGM